MANTELKTLKEEAKNLSIEFANNITMEKLQEKVDKFYESGSKGDVVKSKPEEPKKEVTTLRGKIAQAKAKAFKKRVVTISNNDKRENDVMTTCFLGMENQYFGISKIVPLDIPVELEECLISIAKDTTISMHKDEVVDGKRTGNKTTITVRKFNISYEE